MDERSTQAGTLAWGIKDSFRDYLSRQVDFSLTVDHGASVGAGNTVEFPLVGAPAIDNVVWATHGHAVFRAHSGMMRLSLKNPVVTKKDGELLLAFDFGSEPDGAAAEYFEVARLEELPSGNALRCTYRTFLLPDATGMFNDMYDAGSELDLITVTGEAAS